MTEVIFTKDAGRFKKDRVVDFPPALADFFVSKVRCAAFVSAQTGIPESKAEVKPEVKAADKTPEDDFSDVFEDSEPVRKPKRHAKSKIILAKSGKLHQYSRRDMCAEE